MFVWKQCCLRSPIDSNSLFAPISVGLKVVVEIEDGSQSKILIEDMPDLLRFRSVDMKLSVLVVIAEGSRHLGQLACSSTGENIADAFIGYRSDWPWKPLG